MLQAAIYGLSLIYREVLLLRDVEELSVEETAIALTISVASVKTRLHRARIMLQKALAPQLRTANPKRRWSWKTLLDRRPRLGMGPIDEQRADPERTGAQKASR